MKRLTERDEFGNADLVGVDSADLQLNLEFEEFNKVTEALNLLATYEDLKLTPHEIKSLLHDGGIGIAMRSQELRVENEQLKQWVNDLQSGMYVNCVYCGHRYGPEDEVPASMADVLKAHIEQCPEHPMAKLKQENEKLKKVLAAMGDISEFTQCL